jgi:HlyD family secretion protein
MKQFALTLILATLFFSGCGNGNEGSVIEGSGTIEATNIILSSKTAGTIKHILADEGALVNKNDTIMIIDHELLDIQLKQAIAGRDLAEAQLKLANKGARSEDIAQAEEMFNQAEANYKLASDDKERMQSLYDSQSITKKQWEDIQTRFVVAQSQYNAAKENVKKIKNISRPEDKQQAKANYDRANAAVLLIEKNIRDSYITTPSKGIIVNKFFEAGESVMPGASLLKLSDLSSVDLVIYVPEAKLGMVKLGQKAEVKIDTFEDKAFEGSVTYISTEAEFTPKNIQTKDERTKLVFAVKISIPNPDFELKAGLPADGYIYVN